MKEEEKKPPQKYTTKSPYDQIQIISKKSIQSCQMAPQKIPVTNIGAGQVDPNTTPGSVFGEGSIPFEPN